ncbi:putative Transmembrane protein [Melia azedarach]|uniref:Transmembrane protein n=1 Tax=Melia azedarach TaxID=155640 RepID=A0ACC1YHC7_MELAZ|nr:putative Transmembrane protein [Melia azedarach]
MSLLLLSCFRASSLLLLLLAITSPQTSSLQVEGCLTYWVQLKYIKESEEMRLAMQPLELIKRVREIQQEAYTEPEIVVQKDAKQTAAVDVSKRLKDLRSVNDAASIKALEEWRKRKMERARQRQLEKNGTTTSQA